MRPASSSSPSMKQAGARIGTLTAREREPRRRMRLFPYRSGYRRAVLEDRPLLSLPRHPRARISRGVERPWDGLPVPRWSRKNRGFGRTRSAPTRPWYRSSGTPRSETLNRQGSRGGLPATRFESAGSGTPPALGEIRAGSAHTSPALGRIRRDRSDQSRRQRMAIDSSDPPRIPAPEAPFIGLSAAPRLPGVRARLRARAGAG
jgi:hypothetical protein